MSRCQENAMIRSKARIFVLFLAVGLALFVSSCKPRKSRSGASSINYDDPRNFNQKINNNVKLQNVHWKLLFHQIFASNILRYTDVQKSGCDSKEALLKRFLYFHPKNINESYQVILAAGKTAQDAKSTKTENELYHETIAQELNDSDVFEEYLSEEALKRYLDGRFPNAGSMSVGPLIQHLKSSGSEAGKSFWDGPDGRLIDELMRGWVLVLVPGFGSHNTDDRIFPEMAHESAGGLGFTILHPSPSDLGNTFTDDASVAKTLLAWLERERGSGRIQDTSRFIFVGYSKGAPVIHEMLRLAKAGGTAGQPNSSSVSALIARNTFYMVTLGGVIQGTPIARDGLNSLKNETQHVPDSAKEVFSIFDMMNMNMSPELILSLRGRLEGFFKAIEFLGLRGDQVSNILNRLEGVNANDLVNGVEDMSSEKRTEWNLKNLNDTALGANGHQVTFMCLGAVTNVDDFMLPGSIEAPEERLDPPSMFPQFYFSNDVLFPDFKRFSIDDLFLWMTSVDSFNKVPGRLFDTQVPLMDTKSPFLDRRPLAETGVSQGSINGNTPRADIFSGFNNAKTLDFVDLGEVRHSHWFPIAQVFNPSTLLVNPGEVYKSPFPRTAFLASLIETITLYHALSEAR